MTCEQAEILLAELLTGEIGPEDRRAIERHLLECAGCRGDFDRARAGMRADWPETPVPAPLVASTRALFDRPPAIVRFLRAGTAAAAALLVILFVAASSPRKPVAPPVRPAPVLASIQEGAVGALFAKDEDGRPVGDLGLKSHVVSVEILDGIAKTTVEENFENHTDRRLEGTFHFPLPPDASISRLALEVNGKMEEGTCLERERAREVFESIVRKMQDPALLEWMPGGMFKCRVFPIEPRATKRVLIAYTQALPFFRGRMTYVYPLASEKTRTHPPGEVRIDVRARVSGRLDRIESPSHRIDVQRRDEREAAMSFRAESYRPENDFVVTMEMTDDEVRVVPHKTDGEDGSFALFLTPRGAGVRKPQRYAFVLDVSASVSAPELEVAKRLVRAMMERRIEGDRFEILAHHIDVERSGDVDVRAANDFMDRLKPVGGSDVQKALLAVDADEIVYIGEGTPTMGETELPKILDAVKGRRIRTVAVGSDANVALLERLGGHQRINPNDDVARRVVEIAETLGSPVLSDLKIDGGDALYDVVGLRDLFYGERLVLAGRYRGPAAKLVITARDYRREVEVSLPAKEEGNSYVRRLWAQRKVADLLARGGPKEEVIALGVKHQIMTPHTSFLVLESEQMWKDYQLKREIPRQDKVLGRSEAEERLDSAAKLYREGKAAEATATFEEAFQLKPSSDQVYAFMKRTGEDLVAQLMNHPERKIQDTGRRLFELAKPGERLIQTVPLRNADSGELAKRLEELVRGGDPATGPYDPNPMRLTQPDFFKPWLKFKQTIIDETSGEVGPGFTTNESARLESYDLRAQTFHALQKGDPLTEFWLGDVGGLYPGGDLSGEWGNHFRMFGSGRERALAAPTAGGQAPLSGATFDLTRDIPVIGGMPSSRAGRFEDRRQKLESDVQVFARQQEVQLAQIQELMVRAEDHRSKLAKSLNEKDSKQLADRLARDFSELEEKYVGMAREKKYLEEKLNHLNQVGVKADIAPKKLLEGKVVAVANEIGLVVISIGKDSGAVEGDEFTVYRGGDFVARIVIDRADARWAAGKVVLKKTDPRVADDASNHIFVKRGGEGVAPASAGTVADAAGDGVLVRAPGLPPGRVVAISRDSKFVALVQMVDPERGRVWMAVGRVLPGDRAEVVNDVRGYLAALPEAVRVELGSRVGLDSIRAKMRIAR
jgi:hypothetical protein